MAGAQDKKPLEFRGTVTAVDAANHRLTVANQPVEGWMGAMTMGYAVDPASPLGAIKPGDRITATVYSGDFTLHEVKVAPPPGLAVDGEAAQTPGLRLEDLERMALANNPTLAQAEANVQVAQGKARQAGLYPNPTIGYYGNEIRGGYTRGGKQGGFVSQTIVTGGKLGAARHMANFETGQATTAGEIQRARIASNVRSLYYRVLAAQRLLEVRRKLEALAGDSVETSRQLGNVGRRIGRIFCRPRWSGNRRR